MSLRTFWIFGFLDFWICGLLDFWIFGFLDFWNFGFLDFWIFGFLDFWIIGPKVNEIAERSFTFQKKVSTVVDCGMSWSHLSAFGHTFLDKCHTSQRLGLLFLKMHRSPYVFNHLCAKNSKIKKTKMVFVVFCFVGSLEQK